MERVLPLADRIAMSGKIADRVVRHGVSGVDREHGGLRPGSRAGDDDGELTAPTSRPFAGRGAFLNHSATECDGL
jgi:hypothetical protein